MHKLKSLWELQEVDKALVQISREITQKELVLHLKGMQTKIKELEDIISKEKVEIKESEGKAKRIEKEIADLEFKKKEQESKLYSGETNVPKELEGMKEKIDIIATGISELEETILVYMDQVEDKTQTLNQSSGMLEELKKKYAKGVRLYQQKKKNMELKKEDALEKQAQLQSLLDKNLLTNYQKIQKLYKNNGIARIENGMCSGCRIEIPIMHLKNIKEGNTIFTCEQCGRIIIDWDESI
ncbi:MAG: zinc ribbon domain-containing protein [Peptococcaceae bacterium]